jgi:hypothetical protein
MEDKKGTKCSRSPASKSSSSSGSASTLPLSLSGSSQPPSSPLEVSSRRLSLPTYEQGGPSERIPVVDLSSDEEDIFPDISRDEEFIRKLFGDLNYGLLGPPGDGNVIILINSDEEKEVREEDTADTEAAPPSAINSPAPTVSTANADDALDGVKMIVMAVAPPIGCKMIVVMVGTKLVHLRLPHQKGCLQEVCSKEFKNNDDFALLHHKLFYKEEW